MAKKKRIIPFWLMPGSWGLSGTTRQTARAEYYYTGIELEKALADIHASDETDAQLRKLDIDLRHEIIDQTQYTKQRADLLNEPYVNVIRMDVDENDPGAGFVELDWNDEFIKMLTRNGYRGKSDDELVNKWFNDLCRTVIRQEMQDQDYGLEEVDDD